MKLKNFIFILLPIIFFSCQKEIKSIEYTESSSYIKITKGKYVGVENADHTVIIPITGKYTDVFHVSTHDHICFYVAKKHGIADCYFPNGNKILSDDVYKFEHFGVRYTEIDGYDLVTVKLQNGKSGLYDSNGQQLLEPIYDEVDVQSIPLMTGGSYCKLHVTFFTAIRSNKLFVFNRELKCVHSMNVDKNPYIHMVSVWEDQKETPTSYACLEIEQSSSKKITYLDADGNVFLECKSNLVEFNDMYIESNEGQDGEMFCIYDWNGIKYFSKSNIYVDCSYRNNYFAVYARKKDKDDYCIYNLKGELLRYNLEELDISEQEGNKVYFLYVGLDDYCSVPLSDLAYPSGFCKSPAQSKFKFYKIKRVGKIEELIGTNKSTSKSTSNSYSIPITSSQFNNSINYQSGFSDTNQPVDNSREVAMYNDIYGRWERQAESLYNSISNFKNSNNTQGYTAADKYGSHTASIINEFHTAQREMQRVRMEASQKGITIQQSYLESVNISLY